ncbi:MAG: trimeric intracellular cation channel family protein [Lentisphaeria bacterium]|nr:trimeric intracellular cation channel family protein [Lentisphaeria bacterium]
MNSLYFLEMVGTVAFAISGVMASQRRRPDFMGAIILAFVTAIGGGIVRDAIIGERSHSFTDPYIFYVIIIAAIAAILLIDKINRIGRVLSVADAIGLGVFTSAGLIEGLKTCGSGSEIPIMFSIVLGAVTGCGGGIIRDVLCARMPTILRPNEIYLSACIAGGLVGVFCYEIFSTSLEHTGIITAVVTITVRLLSIRYKWKIPAISGQYGRVE